MAVLAGPGTTDVTAMRAATAGLGAIAAGLLIWIFTRGYGIERPLRPVDRWYETRSLRMWQDWEQERRDREDDRRT